MSGRVNDHPDLRKALDHLEERPDDTAALERLGSVLRGRAGGVASSKPNDSKETLEVDDAERAVRLLLDSARVHDDNGDDRSTKLALTLARMLAGDADALVSVAKVASELNDADEVIQVLHALLRDHADNSDAISDAASLIGTDHIEEAITAYRSIAERDPHRVQTWADLVDALNSAYRPDEALGATEDALTENPGNPTLLAQQAGDLYLLNQDTGAIEAAEAAVADPMLGPDSAVPALEVLRLAGQRDRVMQLLDKYLEKSPTNARLRIVMGNLLTETGDYNGAFEQYELARRDPAFTETAEVANAQALRQCGRLSEAAALLGHWATSRDVDTLFERASLAFAQGDLVETERILRPVVDQDPSDDQALRLLSMALRLRHDFVACERLLDRKFKGRAARTAATERGYLALDEGSYQNAERAFRALLEDQTEPIEAVDGLSDTLRAQGKLSEARELMRRALEEHPGDTLLRQQLGWVAYDEHKYDEAAEVFGSLVEQDPYDSVSRRWQASSLRLAMRPDEARQVLDGAPGGQDDPYLDVERGWLSYEESKYGEAEATFRRVLDGKADPIDAAWGLSAVLRAQGRPAEAAKSVEEAQGDHPADPLLQREIGWVAYDQRRYEDAVRIFKDLVRKDELSILDRRWLAASLRMAKRYREAQVVLGEAPQPDDPGLDLERGWVAYDQSAYDLAVRHFQAARDKGAATVEYVPPLVSVLLRQGDVDAAEQAVNVGSAAPALVVARSEVLMGRGRPQDAIEVLMRVRKGLDEAALLRLVKLLQASNRGDDAREVLAEWLSSRTVSQQDQAGSESPWASPELMAADMELASCDLQLTHEERISKIDKALRCYAGDDPVPAVITAAAIRTLRTLHPERAQRLALESATREPADIDILMEVAQTSFVRCGYTAALAGFERVLQLDDGHERATQWCCRALRRMGHWRDLDDYLAVRIKKHPDSARLHIELGWLCFSRGDHHAALQAFTNATRIDGNSGQALFGRVSALRELERWSEAEKILKDWKSRWPHSRRRELAEGILRIDRGQFGQAYELFEANEDVAGVLGRAAVSVRTFREDAARHLLEQAIDDYPDRPGPKIALASLLSVSNSDQEMERAKKLERAEEYYDKAIGYSAETDAAALGGRAYIALKQKRPRAAESLFKDAMELNPNGPYPAGIAEALIQRQRAEEAVDLLEERVRANRDDGASYRQLYFAHAALGHRDQAVAALRSALAANPGDDAVAVALAYALEESDRSVEAEKVLCHRLRTQPDAAQNQLRLGLAWILLARGDRSNTPALVEEAAKQATYVLQTGGDAMPAGVDPTAIQEGALSCRGTAYYKLAERERNPGERLRLADLARKDQHQRRSGWQDKPSSGIRWLMRLAFRLDNVLRLLVFLASGALLAVLWTLHATDATDWNTAMVVSLTPLLLAVAVLAALLPSLQTLRLAGLEAQTRERAADVLPTSGPVTLPQATEFAAATIENFIEFVNIDDLYSSAVSPRASSSAASPRAATEISRIRKIRAPSAAMRAPSDVNRRPAA
jgi:tetratricopeptide (TPR) repeat protein